MPPRQRTVFLCSRYVILYDERHFTIHTKPKSISLDWSFAVNFQQRPAKPLFAAKCETPLPRLVAFRGAAARRIHDICPRSATFMRVTGGVLFAAVGLCVGNAPPNDGPIIHPTAQPRADKRLRRRHRVNRIVLCRQSAHIVFGQNLHAPISLSPTSSFLLYPN